MRRRPWLGSNSYLWTYDLQVRTRSPTDTTVILTSSCYNEAVICSAPEMYAKRMYMYFKRCDSRLVAAAADGLPKITSAVGSGPGNRGLGVRGWAPETGWL